MPRRVLTDAETVEIYRRSNAGEYTQYLANEFGVSAARVSQIKHGTRGHDHARIGWLMYAQKAAG
jgi:hypothetical protein